MAKNVTVIGLQTIPLVREGDDLTVLILEACQREGVDIGDGDVVVVTHKIVSKAEGRVFHLEEITPSKEAERLAELTFRDPRLIELVLQDTEEVLKATPEGLIVKNVQGGICLNAGADRSNVSYDYCYSLLPRNPDASALRILSGLREFTGKKLAVIISDTYTRPFRKGQVDFAIGVAGIWPFRDYRHTGDIYGKELMIKNVAVIDEVASAAELVIGQSTEKIPVAIVKNLEWEEGEASIKEMNLTREEDLYKGVI